MAIRNWVSKKIVDIPESAIHKMTRLCKSMTFAKNLLQIARVSTTPGVAFRGEGHIRMSFCVPEETIHKAFDRMEEYFPLS